MCWRGRDVGCRSELGGKWRGDEGFISQESAGPGERGGEEWVVARDFFHGKLNPSSSLLLRPQIICPWAQSAD